MLESEELHASRNGATTIDRMSQLAEADQSQLSSRASEILDGLQNTIRRYPAVSLGVAVATGLAIGWLVKRR